MIITVKGTISHTLGVRSGVSRTSGNAWKSQDFVIKIDESEDTIAFNVFGEDLLNKYNFKVGDKVTIALDVKSRPWNDKWYTSLRLVELDARPQDGTYSATTRKEEGKVESQPTSSGYDYDSPF